MSSSSKPYYCPKGTLFNETPEERAKIIDQIRINGQLLKDSKQLQTVQVLNIDVPDGFRGIAWPDDHAPYSHMGINRAGLALQAWWAPHLSVGLGDSDNWGMISRFAQNPRDGSPFTIRSEQEQVYRTIDAKAHAGNPALHVELGGNHARTNKYEAENAPAMSQMRNAQNLQTLTDYVTNILGFTEKDPVMFCWGVGQTGGREGGFRMLDTRFRHGNIVDQKPGYSSYRHWFKSQDNTVMGHVHDVGDWAVENKDGKVSHGAEGGNTVNWNSPAFNYNANEHGWVHAVTLLLGFDGVLHVIPLAALPGIDDNGEERLYFTLLDLDGNIVEFPVYEA